MQITLSSRVADRCPEKYLVGPLAARLFRVNDFRLIDALAEKADTPVDFPQASFTVLIVRVFAAVASRAGRSAALCS